MTITNAATASSTPVSEHLAALIEATRATLSLAATDFAPATFASSLAAEDMVLTDLMLKDGLPIDIFTLETGRLHPETLGMLDRIRETYQYDVTPYRPDTAEVDHFVQKNGLNAMYDGIDLRKECCRIRKIEPLKRALQGKTSWITGQRREQSQTRAALHVQERDEAHNLVKFNPLADWSQQDVWDYLHHFNVPYNPLHDRGFPSIGCEPCTRAISPGEDIRAGRWWWENPESKECGLHVVDGKLVRIKPASQDAPVFPSSGVVEPQRNPGTPG